jgi:hypothetical protein
VLAYILDAAAIPAADRVFVVSTSSPQKIPNMGPVLSSFECGVVGGLALGMERSDSGDIELRLELLWQGAGEDCCWDCCGLSDVAWECSWSCGEVGG